MEGGMITRSSWHICLWVLMGATAVQRGENEGKGVGEVVSNFNFLEMELF